MPAKVESSWVLGPAEDDEKVKKSDGDVEEGENLGDPDEDDLDDDDLDDEEDLEDDDEDDDLDDDLIDLDDEYDEAAEEDKPHPGRFDE